MKETIHYFCIHNMTEENSLAHIASMLGVSVHDVLPKSNHHKQTTLDYFTFSKTTNDNLSRLNKSEKEFFEHVFGIPQNVFYIKPPQNK